MHGAIAKQHMTPELKKPKRKRLQIEKDAETRFITNASPIVRLGVVLKHVQNGQKWSVMLAEV